MSKRPTAAFGREYLAIPGPSVIPDAVLSAMHRPAPNIYAGELIDMTASLIPDLRRVARTDGHVAIYIGNGHAAWEAALANTLAPGEKVLVPATGRFAHGWAEMAKGLGPNRKSWILGNDPQSTWNRLRTHCEQIQPTRSRPYSPYMSTLPPVFETMF